jgi:hypothetical protein
LGIKACWWVVSVATAFAVVDNDHYRLQRHLRGRSVVVELRVWSLSKGCSTVHSEWVVLRKKACYGGTVEVVTRMAGDVVWSELLRALQCVRRVQPGQYRYFEVS